MFKLFFCFLALVVGAFGLIHQQNSNFIKKDVISCHPAGPGDNMNQFANDPAFVAMHIAPLPINYLALGENVSFPASDGIDAKAYLIKAKTQSDRWLFVFQEWWGVNDYIKMQSDSFYNALGGNVNVLALDMYDGKVAADTGQARQMMMSASEPRLVNIVNAAIKYVGDHAVIANVGWCFGGGWSLKSAIIEDRQNIGTVMYYGMPVQDVEKLRHLNSDVLGLFANEQFITKEIIEEFGRNMRSAGKTLTYKIYDAGHGFANPSNPRHNEAMAKDAYGMALTYLKKKFKVS